jgi:uncharacterized protein YceH (UPF0502 family)
MAFKMKRVPVRADWLDDLARRAAAGETMPNTAMECVLALHARVAALEAQVAEIQSQLAKLIEAIQKA